MAPLLRPRTGRTRASLAPTSIAMTQHAVLAVRALTQQCRTDPATHAFGVSMRTISKRRTVCLAVRGIFSNASAQTACDRCAVGKHMGKDGATACVDCAAGTASSSFGSSKCRPCDEGTYLDSTGSAQTACDRCAVWKHMGTKGATACVDCAAGSASSSIGSTDTSCVMRGHIQTVRGCLRVPIVA